MTRFGWMLSSCLLACGPSRASSPASEEGQSGGVAEPKLDVPEDGSSSSGGNGCTDVVEGDVEVNDQSDFEWLRTVREIRGGLTIAELTGHTNLEFLGCLETVQGIWVKDTQSLRSLEGLGRVKTLEWGFSVTGNASLETLRGLDSLESIGVVWIYDNPELSRLELESPTDIASLRLGWYECDGYGPDATAIPRGDNPKLKGLDGLGRIIPSSNINFVIQGQSGFESTQTIVDVVSRIDIGVDNNFPSTEFHLNSKLSRSEIEAVFEAKESSVEDVSHLVVCENRDDDNKCSCKGGE